MAIQYPPYVRKRGYLTASPTRAFLDAPAWGLAMFQRAMFEFNRMAVGYKLGVYMVPADQELLPYLSAEVFIDAHAGSGTYRDIDGIEKKIPLPVKADAYEGFTLPVNGGGSKLYPGFFRYRSYVYMLAHPSVSGTTVGPGVRLSVLLHELIHACGLEGTDPNHGVDGHMPGAPHDLFCTGGLFQTVTGDRTHEQDYITWFDEQSPGRNGEFKLTARTIKLIQDNWSR